MKLFGRERETLKIRQARGSRAIFVDHDVQEIQINLRTPDGEDLTLLFDPRTVAGLIGDLTDAYEAIFPPLSRRQNSASHWDGSGT